MRPKKYYLELFNVNIFYFIHWPAEKYSAYCLKHYGMEGPSKWDKAETTFIHEDVEPKCVLIWVRPGQPLGPVLAHEIHHAVNFIHAWAEVKADHENDEAGAYLTELLFKKATS